MRGVESAERIRRDWVVEWDDPDLEPPLEAAPDPDLRDAVRGRLAARPGARPGDDPRRADEPARDADSWMTGEPMS